MKKITSANYTKDQLYPVVERAVAEILIRGNCVTPVDVLLQLQRITKSQYEDWRFGRIPYLERVTIGGLGKMYRILRIIDFHCRKLNLTASQSVYHKWGKGGKRIILRFSKSGEPNLEAAYSRRYVPEKLASLPRNPPAESPADHDSVRAATDNPADEILRWTT